MIVAVVVVGGALVLLALDERRRAARRPGLVLARAGWGALCAVLVGLALTLTLVQRNETKFLNLALLALAVPAGVALARRPAVAALAIALVALPTTLVAATGFARDPGNETLGRRLPPVELAAAYARLRDESRPRDLVLEAQPDSARDPDRDLLVHGPRAYVWGGDGYAGNWGYDATDLAARRRAARELAAGAFTAETLIDLSRRAAAADGRVFAVRHAAEAAPLGDPWVRVFAEGGIVVDRLGGPTVRPGTPREEADRRRRRTMRFDPTAPLRVEPVR